MDRPAGGLPAGRTGTPAERLRALVREHIGIAVREYPAALRLFLAPQDWPDAQRRGSRSSAAGTTRCSATVVEEGLASGDFTVTAVDAALQCMHAAMSQTPAWCAHLAGRARERAIEEFADTVLMLVGVLPRRPGRADDPSPRGAPPARASRTRSAAGSCGSHRCGGAGCCAAGTACGRCRGSPRGCRAARN